MRRAVFDSNVLISALANRGGGLSHELIALARDGQFELVLSTAIILETWRKLLTGEHLRAAYGYSDDRALRFCRGLHRIANTTLRSTQPLSGIARDPNDDMILACAVDGGADTIVSRDKDLLALGAYRQIAIITPEVFRQQLRELK